MSRPATIVYHCCRLVVALVFFYAGMVKAVDPVGFAGQVANYQLLPYAWNVLVAATLPYLEILCGVLLLANQRVRPALLVLIVLNLVFMVLLGSVLVRGLDIDCGCFSTGNEQGSSALQALLRDIGLMLALIAAWMLHCRMVGLQEKKRD